MHVASYVVALATDPVPIFPRVLLVVEGIHDIGFLTRISAMLHAHHAALPDLSDMERRGELVFVPFGGGDVRLWVDRLAPLSVPEFHLYDREASPETEIRQGVVNLINTRPRCRAVLTMKRSLENYLHPTAVHQAFDFDVHFGDNDNVADLIAQRLYNGAHKPPWCDIPRRAQVRSGNRVKKVLHTKAVDCMTPELLAERDPRGEVAGWLATIADMACA